MQKAINFIKEYKWPLLIFSAAVIAFIIGLIISLGFDKVDIATSDESADGEIVANTSEGVISDVEFGGLSFTNISLITQNGYSTFSADVTNITETVAEFSDVSIILKDSDGNTVITLRGNIGDDLESGETRTITAVTKGSLDNVTSKEITEYESAAQS